MRTSYPVRSLISLPMTWPMPLKVWWPNWSTPPSSKFIVPSLGMAPSATTMMPYFSPIWNRRSMDLQMALMSNGSSGMTM